MWILECDGDIFQMKKLWLRPGKQYLFGRTTQEGGKYAGFTIAHRSVSRKHLTITVSAIKPGDGSLIRTRSELHLHDEGTKFGTEIDGEKISRGEEKILRKDEHVFRLGNYDNIFRIKWQPVVLSFNLHSKETKEGKDPLIQIRSRLEDLEIKTILPYIIDTTTHVVAPKRNTVKCLQALINGKYIVGEPFLDALVYATTPGNLDELESLSPLEEDFDKGWPDAMEYLPDPGKYDRPNELFAPQSDRRKVFEGYTIVFLNLRQYENLQAPITTGGGKVIHFPIKNGQTSAGEVVRFVKNTAGEKGIGKLLDGSVGKGVVVVKFPEENSFENWSAKLQFQIAQILDLRLIEQNEFLDAILLNDASQLRRALPKTTPEGFQSVASTSGHVTTLQTRDGLTSTPTQSEAIENAPVRQRRPRGQIISAFKGFDNGFDVTPLSPAKDNLGDRQIGISHQDDPDPVLVDTDVMESTQGPSAQTTVAKRQKKRSLPSDDSDEDGANEALLSAAAAMKRRKIEEEKEGLNAGVSRIISKQESLRTSRSAKTTETRQELNIQDIVRERRKEEDEAARRDEENLREPLASVSVEAMKNLAVVEEMEIPERSERPFGKAADRRASNEWDERWNGRKNFKKFRRQGREQLRRGQSVIVPLEEVKKKEYGIGEKYWLESDKSKKKRQEERSGESQSQLHSTVKSQLKEVPTELVIDDDEVIDVEAPRRTRLMDKESQVATSSDQSQRNGKRRAPSEIDTGTVKKQKVFEVERSDSDSEDEMKFRFKKRS